MNKTIVITGGSDGLGKALTEALAAENTVIAIARNEQALKNVAKDTGCSYKVCDVRSAEQVQQIFEEITAERQTIDVLINNAGVIVNGELPEIPDDAIENVITTNTLGSIYVAKAVLKQMRKQKSGLIVNVISQSGLNAKAGRSIYNASKWALTGFTKALQDEAGSYGVRVTGFYPGTIRTDLFAKAGLEMKGSALTVAQAVASLRFIMDSDEDILIPELGVKHV